MHSTFDTPSQDEAKPLRFRLPDADDIRRFLAAVGRIDEVAS